MNKRNLLVATILLALGLLALVLLPTLGALASDQKKNVIECEAGYEIVDLPRGRVRIVGECTGLEKPDEPERAGEAGNVYPGPDVYPEPEADTCDGVWYLNGECLLP